MFILKKPPRSHALGEPLLHENHARPRTRRDFIAAGLLSGPAVVMAPAWLGALLRSGRANAGNGPPPLDADIAALVTPAGECDVPGAGIGLPFICFDLAGGANLVGSEVIVGQQSGSNVLNTQTNFLTTAGYGKLGVPGNQVPSSTANIDASLGLLWHADGAIKRGIMSMITPTTAAGVNGAVICAMSQNDTQTNPHNPMYGIAMAGRKGQLLQLIGTESSVSGGNSMAPMELIVPALQPSTISQPSDAVALVPAPPKSGQDPLAVEVLETQTRISGGTGLYQGGTGGQNAFSGALGMPTALYPADPVNDAKLKNQVRCAYVKAVNTANEFGNPSALDPTADPNIISIASKFGANAFMDNEFAKTATVMKLVLSLGGLAGAGTITMGGYDYHDGTRATGETRNFKAGQMIGAVLQYAALLGVPVMIYVFSDGSLNSNSMVDSSTAGRGKLGWQGDNSSVASTFFLVYNPSGRPALRGGTGVQQIGAFTSDGSVVSTSSPAANSVDSLVQTVLLNYMGLSGTDANFANVFQAWTGQPQALGSAAQLAGLTVFQPIV
ncbi:MAG: general secretion pathway protein GspF [Gammaproteobacteria bacterium]|nr:general secretion pathway protein GspF [Gammaproteobacteria bacterium]